MHQTESRGSFNDLTEIRNLALDHAKAAYQAERYGKYKEAFNQHTRAGNLLQQIVSNGVKKSDERRRDKLLLRASLERRDILQSLADGLQEAPPPRLPPTESTIVRDMTERRDRKIWLSLVETGDWKSLAECKNYNEWVSDQHGVPFFTPMLSPEAPDVVYRVYQTMTTRGKMHWVYFHFKDVTDVQTMYTMYAGREGKAQFDTITLARSTEYESACAVIDVQHLEGSTKSDVVGNSRIGRTLTIATSQGIPTRSDTPDRALLKHHKSTWTPRRFSYGGRRFVWREVDGDEIGEIDDLLFELKREWVNEDGQMGKDRTFDRPIASVTRGGCTSTTLKAFTISISGDVDPLFQEFILASAGGKEMVALHGHS
ncbi:hypothetical protein CVT24_011738 [Panaeolus cyanescens]|uniref:MIT domain-containing protein n=1 Tax=Panaeolus cyanescens TaxID=181874 RepID=A0A409YNJ5_9AGAR|nr:hypothetical protein CVT24_011738 [Panaeolus cyanescens]